MGLTCHITRLHLISVGGDPQVELRMILAIIEDARPSHLGLILMSTDIDLIPSIMQHSLLVANLETFELRIYIREVPFRFNLTSCLVRFQARLHLNGAHPVVS